ncbi:DUF2783 domain-containing protein [Sneathiella chungangensis]|uniref:DUF2783 domain-containing protein n=1 Tax=Sneathiella chungangensis TaxID=1418234 RepID=A0A845MKW3_9PROT|nr:DUF2783 domain-containing protein [Sneathiella chungangensis]MZR24162.1 DUF2783 domain-containing protein [Sneathiella chungangensis]
MSKRISPEDNLQPHGDEFYELLMKAHEGLDFDQSAALNARLVLILANEVGDLTTLSAAIDRAARS